MTSVNAAPIARLTKKMIAVITEADRTVPGHCLSVKPTSRKERKLKCTNRIAHDKLSSFPVQFQFVPGIARISYMPKILVKV